MILSLKIFFLTEMNKLIIIRNKKYFQKQFRGYCCKNVIHGLKTFIISNTNSCLNKYLFQFIILI
jgi:hypothetical protein